MNPRLNYTSENGVPEVKQNVLMLFTKSFFAPGGAGFRAGKVPCPVQVFSRALGKIWSFC